MSGSEWFVRPGGGSVPIVPPLNTLTGAEYLQGLLAQQGIALSPTYLLLGDGSEVAGDTTHTPQNGVLVGEPVDATSQVNLSSPLVLGRIVMPTANARLVADLVSTMEVGAGSGLVAVVARSPLLPALSQYVVGKRQTVADNNGWEQGVDAMGQLTANMDTGPALTGSLLSLDETRGLTVGAAWHCWVWYRDASRDVVQIASNRQLGAFVTVSGDLTSTSPFAVGAVRTAGALAGSEVLLVAGFLGSQVEGLFTNGASFKANELGKNIMHHIALPILADVAGALSIGLLQ